MADRIAVVPRDPLRSYLAPDAIYDPAMKAARRRRMNLARDVIRPALRDFAADPEAYVAAHPPEPEEDDE